MQPLCLLRGAAETGKQPPQLGFRPSTSATQRVPKLIPFNKGGGRRKRQKAVYSNCLFYSQGIKPCCKEDLRVCHLRRKVGGGNSSPAGEAPQKRLVLSHRQVLGLYFAVGLGLILKPPTATAAGNPAKPPPPALRGGLRSPNRAARAFPPPALSLPGLPVPRYVPLPAAPAGPGGGGQGSTPPRLPAGAHACRRRRPALIYRAVRGAHPRRTTPLFKRCQ